MWWTLVNSLTQGAETYVVLALSSHLVGGRTSCRRADFTCGLPRPLGCALQILFVLIEEDVLWTTPWDPYWAAAPGVANPGLPLHS